jgi:hypothetical protein
MANATEAAALKATVKMNKYPRQSQIDDGMHTGHLRLQKDSVSPLLHLHLG